MIRTDLGAVTAYAYARQHGYVGTEAQFEEDIANAANVYPSDTTLSISAKAADAKATGKAIKENGDALENLNDLFSDAIQNDALLKRSIHCVVKTKQSWQSQEELFDIPDGATVFYIQWDSANSDSGSVPNTKFRFDWLDSADTEISHINVTVAGATLIIPSGAKKVNFVTYVNNASAENEWVEYANLVVSIGTRAVHTYIKDDVLLKSRTVDQIDALLDSMEMTESAIKKSKNILTSEFAQGVINATTGVYGETSVITNTATPDLIAVSGNMIYTLSWDWNRFYNSLYLFEYNSSRAFIERTVLDSWTRRISYKSFITNSNTAYVRFMFYSNVNTEYEEIVPVNPQLEIGGIRTQKENLYDISSMVDFETVRNPKLSVPEYYFENGYLQNKVNFIRNLMFNANGNYDAFMFITDTHWEINQQKSTALIRYIKKAVNVNKIFHGGDVYDVWSSEFHDEMLKEIESAFGMFPYCITGNHEYKNQMDDPKIWHYLNSLHRDIIPGNALRNYYYVDEQTTKTRYIVLNVFGDNDNDAVYNFEAGQSTWFANVALNVPTEWNIIVFAHAVYDIVGNLARPLTPVSDVTDTITKIVDNYSGEGKIVCIIQGHTHIDRITRTPGGVPVIITTCDKNGMWINPSTGIGDLSYVNRESGTINEQAFDVFVVDYYNKLISAVRIGSPAFNGIDDNIGTQVEVRQVSYT